MGAPSVAGTAGSRLVYYPDSEPGILRRRQGRGFSYIAPDGTRIDDPDERARIAAIAVPPAYENVWISPLLDGHLQATGQDARSRKQYRYHPDWAAARQAQKFDGLAQFGAALPRLRAWIVRNLKGEEGSLDMAIACVLGLLDRGSLRIGHEDYTNENGSYGATTLRDRHVRFEGETVKLNYTAKGGDRVEKSLSGSVLQEALQRSHDLPGASLISWIDDDGEPRDVRSEHVNAVISDICGEGATAKTFRTWNGSHAALKVALERDDLTITAMSEAAAERLHNTPTIARNSYIHPDVIALSEKSLRDRERVCDTHDKARLRAGEAELLHLLDQGGSDQRPDR